MADLREQRCRPGAKRLEREALEQGLAQLDGWKTTSDRSQIECNYRFADYAATIAFVNAVAAIADEQDHHPEMLVGYSAVTVRYTTHDAGGLTLNDLICAARVDARYRQGRERE